MIVKIGQSPFVLVVESFNQKTGVRNFNLRLGNVAVLILLVSLDLNSALGS